MKVAIAAFMHESNTFAAGRTGRRQFETGGIAAGQELIDQWKDSHHELAGFVEGAERFGFQPDPILAAVATPAGPVDDAMLDEVADRLVEHLKAGRRGRPADGLLLALHGAMVCPSYPDADGELLTRVRQCVGPDLPIVVTLDFHANISERMVQQATAAVLYQTNPHVDQKRCGLRAAELMVGTVSGRLRPKQALAKPPMLISIACQDTQSEPLRGVMALARQLESRPAVLAACVAAGFPYADVPEMGPSALVVTDGDVAGAQQAAAELADHLWVARPRLVRQLPDAVTAVAQARRCERLPVVLVDFGDNVGGGSPADGTIVLAELLRQRAAGAVIVLFDPDSVDQAVASGLGRWVELNVGGKTDPLHGQPVRVRGRVVRIHDGRWSDHQPRHGGRRTYDQGHTVVLQVPVAGAADPSAEPGPVNADQVSDTGSTLTLVLNSKRTPPFSLGQLTSLGIDPARQRILVVKAAIAYRAAYGPIAGQIIEADTPGWTSNNLSRFTYTHLRRPMYPLDPDIR